MADWNLRLASPTDAAPIADLRAVVMRPDLERLGRYDPHRVRRRFRDAFDPTHTWIIEVAGTFAGCVALRPAADAHWLEHFYLAPHLQGSPARRLYERHGFHLEREDPVDVFMLRTPTPPARK